MFFKNPNSNKKIAKNFFNELKIMDSTSTGLKPNFFIAP